jgi:segregation and condensation protein A
MEWLLGRIKHENSFVFTNLFPEGVTLRRLVATFLAMLELTRLKKLRIRQTEAFTDILIDVVVDQPTPAVAELPAATTVESAVATVFEQPPSIGVEKPLETIAIPPTVTE